MIELDLTGNEANDLLRLAAALNTDVEGVVEWAIKMVVLPNANEFLGVAAQHAAAGWMPSKNKN